MLNRSSRGLFLGSEELSEAVESKVSHERIISGTDEVTAEVQQMDHVKWRCKGG